MFGAIVVVSPRKLNHNFLLECAGADALKILGQFSQNIPAPFHLLFKLSRTTYCIRTTQHSSPHAFFFFLLRQYRPPDYEANNNNSPENSPVAIAVFILRIYIEGNITDDSPVSAAVVAYHYHKEGCLL